MTDRAELAKRLLTNAAGLKLASKQSKLIEDCGSYLQIKMNWEQAALTCEEAAAALSAGEGGAHNSPPLTADVSTGASEEGLREIVSQEFLRISPLYSRNPDNLFTDVTVRLVAHAVARRLSPSADLLKAAKYAEAEISALYDALSNDNRRKQIVVSIGQFARLRTLRETIRNAGGQE